MAGDVEAVLKPRLLATSISWILKQDVVIGLYIKHLLQLSKVENNLIYVYLIP
jgi:hypothetical protein